MDGESEARINDYLEEKARTYHEDKDEEERKESLVDVDKKKNAKADAASPVWLSPSGTAADEASGGKVTSGGGTDSQKDSRVRKDKDEDDANKIGKKIKTRQDAREKADTID